MSSSKEILIKKLYWKSCNRGLRENDIFLGRFAKLNLEKLDKIELENYGSFLNETDPDIFDWVTRKKELPLKYKNTIIEKILECNISNS
ncbi:MAG: succinate dehydrogenase assembly factor 2 [Alphaproteobacteria bacterium]